tara:strand:- start:45 stop:242 length:198 start_codon:yes stop_codon:yes gene_type:complete
MADYQLRKFTFDNVDVNGKSITVTHEDILDKRTTPHRAIPKNEENRDYQEYLAWVSEGNSPDPAD